jgi:hypothetical protein
VAAASRVGGGFGAAESTPGPGLRPAGAYGLGRHTWGGPFFDPTSYTNCLEIVPFMICMIFRSPKRSTDCI